MSVSTAVAAWLVATAPISGEDAVVSQRALVVAMADAEQQTSPKDEGDIIVSGQNKAPREDPLQAINIGTYKATQAVDEVIVAPAAKAYSATLPEPVRDGVRNFFNNLTSPVTFINDILQLHFGRAAKSLVRFAVNSTVGIAGLIDVAKRKPIGIPYRRNGFANTLGYYGIKSGAFLYVPLIGPTTVRDLVGLVVDRLFLPTVVGKPFNKAYYAVGATIVGSLDYRVEYDEAIERLRAEPNPYASARANYLYHRQVEIDWLHGKITLGEDNPARAAGPRPRGFSETPKGP